MLEEYSNLLLLHYYGLDHILLLPLLWPWPYPVMSIFADHSWFTGQTTLTNIKLFNFYCKRFVYRIGNIRRPANLLLFLPAEEYDRIQSTNTHWNSEILCIYSILTKFQIFPTIEYAIPQICLFHKTKNS